MTRDTPRSRPTVLWEIEAYGRETHPVGKTYWWDLAERPRGGHAIVQLAAAGTIRLRSAGQERPVLPGSLMLLFPGDDVQYGQPEALTEPYRCRWVNVRGAGLAKHLRSITDRHGPVLRPGLAHPLVDQVEQLIVLAAADRPAPPTSLASAVHHFVMSLHDFADDRFHQQLRPVEQAIELIYTRPHQTWSLKEVAAQHGVSREHLSRLFQDRVGQSAQSFLNEARRGRALALLKHTRLPLAEVARQAGYANVHTLGRQVRTATGFSPTAYRGEA